MGWEEPMKEFPPLVSKEFELKGQGFQKASPDIKMSSVGNTHIITNWSTRWPKIVLFSKEAGATDTFILFLGWVRVTGVEGNRFLLRAHAPEGTGLSLNSPPLLPNFINPEGRAHQHISLLLIRPGNPRAWWTPACPTYIGAERLNLKKNLSA